MTITKENFKDVWKRKDLKYRYSKKCVAIGTFVTSIGELLLAVGLIATQFYVTKNNITDLQTLVNFFVGCIAFVTAVCICWTLLVHIVYHPFKTKYQEDVWDESAKALVKLAVDTRTNVKKMKKGISNAAWGLYILCVMLDLLAKFMGFWEPCISYFVPQKYLDLENGGLIVMIVIELTTLCFVHLFFKFITKWLFFCPMSYKEVVSAELFRLEVEEEIEGKSDKEKEILSDILIEKGVLALAQEGESGAKDYFLKSALLGNVAGMDRYALLHAGKDMDKEIAIYWYKKCIASGTATKDTKKHLRQVKNGITVDNYY